MRIKVHAKDHGIPQLEVGKKYYIAYAGCTYVEKFLFTRKNRIELCEIEKDGEQERKTSSHWVSRKNLKEILNSGAILWVWESDGKSEQRRERNE